MKKKRRGRGEGSVRQRSDGTWEAILSLGAVDGKRRRVSVYAGSKDAVLHKLRNAQGRVGDFRGTPPTVAEWIGLWLEESRARLADSTAVRYVYLAAKIRGSIGGVRLDRLTASHLSALPSGVWERRKCHALLRACLNAAVSRGIVPRNVARDAPPPPRPEQRGRILNGEESRRLIRAAQAHPLGAFVALALATGARLGELRALQWGDVDLERGTVRIERTVEEVDGREVIKTPKTRAGRRTVTAPPSALAQVAEIPRTCEWVFASRANRPVRLCVVYRNIFRPACQAAKIDGLKFHDLRHTHASELIRAGVSLRVVSARLGHASPEFTLRTYCHLLPGDDGGAAEVAEKIFRNSP